MFKLFNNKNKQEYIVRVNSYNGITTYIIKAFNKEDACLKAIKKYNRNYYYRTINSVYTIEFKNGRFDD